MSNAVFEDALIEARIDEIKTTRDHGFAVNDTEANVRSIVLAIHRYVKERPDGILHGQYFDTVVKRDGQWKFKRRELRTTMTTDYHVKAFNPIGRAE